MKRTPLVLVAVFVVIAIVIPALVVLPFSEKENPGTSKVLAKANIEQQAAPKDPDIPVSVMRNETKQVDQVQLREYLIGVVGSEMPAEFDIEALKAQALAARTYVARFLINVGAEPKAISDTPNDQVYHGTDELKKIWGSEYEAKLKKIEKAVDATAGEVLTFQGQLITPFFFSTSNGYTENAEAYWQNATPYLKSVKSPWDLKSPKYKKTVTLSVKEVQDKLKIRLPQKDGTVGTILSLTPGKRVAEFKIGGKMFTGREVREKLNLRSADFAMKRAGNNIEITTKGYGHGVGMSQYGAGGMAKEGKTYKEIVQYYYQGVTIAKLSDFLK
ncbi:MAG: stage II sporulation protein D [Tuberibacillus sp.]